MTETEYEVVRRKLAFFFRHNGCSESDAPDLIAESVLRVMRKEHDGTETKEPVAYAFGVAKHLLDEYRARPEAAHCEIDTIADTAATARSDATELEMRDHCLAECFEELSARNKKVIRECLQTASPLSPKGGTWIVCYIILCPRSPPRLTPSAERFYIPKGVGFVPQNWYSTQQLGQFGREIRGS